MPPPAVSDAIPRRLNLGCGRQHQPDCFNVDLRSNVQPDLVWDLNRRPYPLLRNHFEHIYALDVIEHLESIPDFLEELHEILAPGGVVEITTPHFSCSNSFTDPTHRHHLGYFSFDYFTAESSLNFYSDARFQYAERTLVFHNSVANRLIARFANRYPQWFERRLAWIFPAWFLIFKLRAIKIDGSASAT